MTSSFDQPAVDKVGSPGFNSGMDERDDARAISEGRQSAHDRSDDRKTDITIVHRSRLFRDCLKRAISASIDCTVSDFSKLSDARQSGTLDNATLLILSLKEMNSEVGEKPVKSIIDNAGKTKVVVLGDTENSKLISDILSLGFHGYIPSNLELDVWIQALRFVLAGGVFAPASAVMTAATSTAARREDDAADQISLTEKQLAVIEAVRRGKANKIIAYELNMCESTVKVHVRAIMKKLKARNRTEVAYIANKLLKDRMPGETEFELCRAG